MCAGIAKMRRISLSLLLCVSVLQQLVTGQSLISILQSTPNTLSTLNSFINASSGLKSLLSTANNFTFLAPNNDAFKKWQTQQGATPPSQDLIDATIAYHLLVGGFPTVGFSNKPRFVSTNLRDSKFTNVTSGQEVELLVLGKDKQIVSGSRTVSTITSPDIVCTGGLIHVIDTVLSIPLMLVPAITQANLTFFIGILNEGGYLNAAAQPLVLPVLQGQNVTFFVPNTADALAQFTSIVANASQSDLMQAFNYHIVPNFIGYSPILRNDMNLRSRQGSNLKITTRGGETFVNQAKIISTDLLVANGVVHTIDGLLDQNNITSPPPQQTQSSNPNPNTNTTTSRTSTLSTLTTASKVGIAVGGALGLLILSVLIALYIRWFRRKRLLSGPRTISGPYVQELEAGSKSYHGYRKSELVESGHGRGFSHGRSVSRSISKSRRDEDKRLEFMAEVVELDGRERSRSRSRSRGRGAVRLEREERVPLPKPFF